MSKRCKVKLDCGGKPPYVPFEKLTTERQALEWTRDLWDWLAENPTKEKGHWPGWKTRVMQPADCPCCGFDEVARRSDENVLSCGSCPLLKLWGNAKLFGAKPESPFLACCRDSSPFIKWKDARYEAKWGAAGKAAKKLANLARKALKAI